MSYSTSFSDSRFIRAAASVVGLLWFLASCMAQADSCRGLSVRLDIENALLEHGQVPRFFVVMNNESSAFISVLDVEGRVDLQYAFAKVVVKSGRDVIELDEVISDPGIIGDDDYVVIEPGGEVTMRMAPPPMDLSALAPGAYDAYLVYFPDPLNSGNRCITPAVEFVLH